MGEEQLHVINTKELFEKLNRKRQAEHQDEVEHHLIASKLGILFALNSNNYINFKQEFVQLTDAQLQTLEFIFSEHFNAHISAEIHRLLMTPLQMQAKIAADLPEPKPTKSFLARLKSIFSNKPNPV